MNLLLATYWIPDAATLWLLSPELVLVATLALVLFVPLLMGRGARLAGVVSLAGCAAAAVLAAMTLAHTPAHPAELFGVPNQMLNLIGPGVLVTDSLGMFFRLFLLVFLVAIIGMWFLFDARRERHAPEFFVLLIGSAVGMALMASTVNLLLMVLAIELASLPSYALAGFDRHRRIAAEASVKYVVFGAATSGFMIYGVSILFGLYGTLHIPTLIDRIAAAADAVHLMPLLAVALLAIFAGIGFKISAVPFHFWCPDVFEGASLPVATWLSVASKAAGLVLLLRLVFLAAGPTAPHYVASVLPAISYGVGIFAVVTCTVANLAAYGQKNVRRMLAYSSIAHAGYMLCAGAVVFRSPELSSTAISALIAYLLVYMFMNLGAFMAVGLVAADSGSEELPAFAGIGWRDPLVGVSLTVCLCSLIGIPPLGGFVVKWWLLYSLGSAAVAGQMPLLWLLTFAVAINTALSLYYYFRVIRQMYLVAIPELGASALQAPLLGKLAVVACAVVLLATGTLAIPALKRNADAAAKYPYVAPPPAAVVEVARES